ncbi:MAG TPA: L,D-transpeptidase family protein, partial [Longimicrobium sp.]|nr:L,D-transpeptidase family protein [Longimicrobium sp.]
MRNALLALALVAVTAAPEAVAQRGRTPAPLQAVVSLTADWDSTGAVLQRYERSSARDPWHAVGAPIAAAVGRTGLAWGRGLHAGHAAGPVKREGDGKAPAGIFALGPAFGYAPADSVPWIRLPYVESRPSVKCVDDARSAFYNRLVDRDTIATPDWSSHEEMRLSTGVYRLGIWVSHNDAPPTPGGGSCIFIHVWQGPGVPTVGCTAMDAADIEALLRWLDPRAAPVLVQAPRAAYEPLRRRLRLP